MQHQPYESLQKNQADSENVLTNPEARVFLTNLLNDTGIQQVDGPKSINTIIEKARTKLIAIKAEPAYFEVLEDIKSKLIDKTQQIHIEAMLLKLIKRAATKTNSTSEALKLVENSPNIKTQQAAAKALEQISGSLQFMNAHDLRFMDINQQLNALYHFESNVSLDFVDMKTIRKKTIQSSSLNNRIDKDNTGLANTIIVDQQGNLFELKNSIDLSNPLEDPTLIRTLLDKANDKFYKDTHTYHTKKTNQVKVILGEGGYGKVRLGTDVLTGEYIAVKKMKSIKHANRELLEKDKLIQALSKNPSDLQYFLTPESIAISHGKDGQTQAYITSKLQPGDGIESLKKLRDLKAQKSHSEFETAHKNFILQTINTLQVLNRNNMVHGDLKWRNIIGGKIGDIEGMCYKFGNQPSLVTRRYLPPEVLVEEHDGKRKVKHPSIDSYNKHMSFTFGLMLLESIDPNIKKTFPLKRKCADNSQPSHGYSKNTPIPEYNSSGQRLSDYEKRVIYFAYSLADTKPENRPTIEEAMQSWQQLIS